MNIEKEFKEKFCYERMDFDGRNRHHYINPTVVEKPQLIIEWIQQQVSVEPEVKVKLAKTDIETLDIEARKFLLDNKCDDLVLNNRPFYKGNYLYVSDIMVKFISKFSE